jgi:DNA-directed RNA polymerase subunit alpha
MLIAQRPSLLEESIEETRSRFVIEPLEPGFGYTIGNSLRRTLLSSIPGRRSRASASRACCTSSRPCPGVKEDVTDIILNLKALVVSSEHDEPVVMYLRKQGPGEVTAATSRRPPVSRCHNPDLHIATLNGKAKLEMELTVERGRGYVSAAQNKQPGQEIGRVPSRLDLLAGPAGHVQGRGHPCRAAHRLRPADPGRRDQAVDAPATRWPSPGKTLVELFGLARELNVEAEGIDIGPVADGRGSRRGPGAADRGAEPHRSVRTTASSARASTRGRAGRPQRAGPARHRQFGAKSIEEVKQKLAPTWA